MDLRAVKVIWLAMTFGLAAYALVAYCLLAFGIVTMEAPFAGHLRYVATSLVVGMVAAKLVRRPMVESIPREAPPAEREQKYVVAVLVSVSLVEGLAIFLVTLSLAAGAPMFALLGGAAGVGVLALSGPSREEAGLPG
jgi:FtsH-binding integral membrane protein